MPGRYAANRETSGCPLRPCRSDDCGANVSKSSGSFTEHIEADLLRLAKFRSSMRLGIIGDTSFVQFHKRHPCSFAIPYRQPYDGTNIGLHCGEFLSLLDFRIRGVRRTTKWSAESGDWSPKSKLVDQMGHHVTWHLTLPNFFSADHRWCFLLGLKHSSEETNQIEVIVALYISHTFTEETHETICSSVLIYYHVITSWVRYEVRCL